MSASISSVRKYSLYRLLLEDFTDIIVANVNMFRSSIINRIMRQLFNSLVVIVNSNFSELFKSQFL